jgi:hypothetical protein
VRFSHVEVFYFFSGCGEARRATRRAGIGRAGVGRVRQDRDDWEDAPLVNYRRLTGGSRASFVCYAAIGARNSRDLERLKVT